MIFGAAAAASTDVDSAVAAAAKLVVGQVAVAWMALKSQAEALGRYVLPVHSQELAFSVLVNYWMDSMTELHCLMAYYCHLMEDLKLLLDTAAFQQDY